MTQNTYIPRIVEAEIKELLEGHPAISIDGPRNVGKTTTATKMAATVFSFENNETLAAVEADPSIFVNAAEPILIDEWQLFPRSWGIVKGAVDADRRPGRFILTGSAAPKTPPTHSGAGRIVSMRMRPMSLAERWGDERVAVVSLQSLLTGSAGAITGETDVSATDYINEMVTGGFPMLRDGATLVDLSPGKVRLAQRRMEGYCERIIDTEFPVAGYNLRNPSVLRSWMSAYAAATASTASFETIRDAATSNEGDKPSKRIAGPYRDTLAKMWLLDPLEAWWTSSNHFTRLMQSSKHHMADPAIAASLLRASVKGLRTGKLANTPVQVDVGMPGRLFESLMALNLRVYAQAAHAKVYHFRDGGGRHEIDFMLESEEGGVLAVEVKFKQLPSEKDYRHLRWLKEKLGDGLIDAVMITTGSRSYRRKDGIAVLPAALLGP